MSRAFRRFPAIAVVSGFAPPSSAPFDPPAGHEKELRAPDDFYDGSLEKASEEKEA